ncbi:MAG: SUMF1/EgtB/PvdO family nonheme iron enzyme [Nitrospinaceae bacterium]|nr:formylglycine-generating enzyme family protein [Nitrospinaceae bacterium]NIR54878.1 formylglycine-generating enzyme family protein [Nitrospinaceae bacterium]NIS85307.1 formylglycine-generating enzyme family protein [Nitrospinaceae bacterium]NIT82116.1 formylglycine-generating enzyme family protein [Nitrospinaceae bacterium]NIU44377.1 formylglycine-generating enzyme family protein [Nitrospinaceae bacterium]
MVRKPIIFLFCAVLLAACDPPPEGMVLVPSGYFLMGTDEVDTDNHAVSLGLAKPWFADESPQRRLYLPDFYIDRYEVTNQQYYIFTQATDHRPPKLWRGRKYPEGWDHLPVTGVTFFDAAAYAEWAGKRLPSEQEWEKAARGSQDFHYPWGVGFDFSKANLSRTPIPRKEHGLKSVGSFPQGASPYGAEDMIGNAWEWVWDYYEPYPGNTWDAKQYLGKRLVVRGMSYLGIGHFPKKEYKKVMALMARVSYRQKMSPVRSAIDVGFRCAKDRPGLIEQWFGKQKQTNEALAEP